MQFEVESLRAGNDDLSVFESLHASWGNGYSLKPAPLHQLYWHARKATQPILDLGSGLSTIVMGEAASVPVHALENDPSWSRRTREALDRLGIDGVTIHDCEMAEGWYAVPFTLPDDFGLVLVDGPQGNRELVFERIGKRIENAVVMFDDVASDDFTCGMYRWNIVHGRHIENMRKFAISQPAAPTTAMG